MDQITVRQPARLTKRLAAKLSARNSWLTTRPSDSSLETLKLKARLSTRNSYTSISTSSSTYSYTISQIYNYEISGTQPFQRISELWGSFNRNKPAAQAADVDPSQWSSTSRQNPPIQQKLLNQYRNFDALQDLKSLQKCQYSLFYDWKTIFNHLGVAAP